MENPILLAPMSGGPGTPELIAAVSNSGGLGSLGAAYLAPEEIAAEIARIRGITSRPFGVNLFAGGYAPRPEVNPAPMMELLTQIHAAWGLPPPNPPSFASEDPFDRQLEAVLAARPAMFSFTFGIPSSAALARLRQHGIAIMGTATTAHEARLLAEADVDIIAAQGSEAGAHRGTFASSFESAMVPAFDLVREISTIVPVPVVASGGLMDGDDIAHAIELGASAAQLGTAFLACPESGASEAYKRAILNARGDTTVVTRAFSGRPARGLTNKFIEMLDGHPEMILPFPQQNTLTRTLRTAAAQRGDSGFLSLWAGKGVARTRPLPAAELVRRLVREIESARTAPKERAAR